VPGPGGQHDLPNVYAPARPGLTLIATRWRRRGRGGSCSHIFDDHVHLVSNVANCCSQLFLTFGGHLVQCLAELYDEVYAEPSDARDHAS